MMGKTMYRFVLEGKIPEFKIRFNLPFSKLEIKKNCIKSQMNGKSKRKFINQYISNHHLFLFFSLML